MKSFLKNMSDRDVKILIYAVFAITTVFFASTLSLPYVLDETGTVANTALWQEMIGVFVYKQWEVFITNMHSLHYIILSILHSEATLFICTRQ